jgi:phosphoribosyl-ATP pyrophosphohydrolase/phosphoribosyl-AMP cyclohydrolase
MTDTLDFLETLEQVIQLRIDSEPDDSYTANLVASGQSRVAQKVGEEALEVALASVCGTTEELLDESADLIFHLLVLLRTQDLTFVEVIDKLKERHVIAEGE